MAEDGLRGADEFEAIRQLKDDVVVTLDMAVGTGGADQLAPTSETTASGGWAMEDLFILRVTGGC